MRQELSYSIKYILLASALSTYKCLVSCSLLPSLLPTFIEYYFYVFKKISKINLNRD